MAIQQTVTLAVIWTLSTTLAVCPAMADEATPKDKPSQGNVPTSRQAATEALSQTCSVECLANQRYSDVAKGKEGLCDIYVPSSTPAAEGRPAVVVVHGGAWVTGDKWTLEGYSRLLASHGFLVMTINYRLAPKHKFPKQVDDVRQALIWLAENQEKFSVDTDRIGLFGYSAGAHLCCMIGMLADEPMETQLKTSEWKADDQRWKKVPSVHAVSGGGTPCDFRNLPKDNSAIAYFLGGTRGQYPDRYAAASPASYVSKGDPVTQFIHGASDFMVPIQPAKKMYREMKSTGVDVRFRVMPGQGHMVTFMNRSTREEMVDFFESVFYRPSLSRWDMRQLGNAPPMKWVNDESPIRELIYEGPPMDGETTDVFAFYATPGTIAGDPSLDKDLPAVVLIHGGGGTAFAEWVWLWAQRGYAAIAMDLSGRRPASPKFKDGKLVSNMRVKRTKLERGGLDHTRTEKFASVGGTLEDDWPYHAVTNAIRAHSLIRSFPETNAEQTAVTGISWGGYTTCITASVDDRFKAAVPVYGCGFLYEGESVQKPAIDALSPEQQKEWIAQYDPSSHLANCRVPIMFVNGTNDKHYTLPSYSKCINLVPGSKTIRIEPKMPHGHSAGWKPKEIGLFVDSHLLGKKSLPKLGALKENDGKLVVTYRSDVPLKSATLNFTTDSGPLANRNWQAKDAEISDGTITAELPTATIVYFTVKDERDAMVSTDVLFQQSKQSTKEEHKSD